MTITSQALGETVTAQLANRGYELNPRSGMISLDLAPGLIPPVPGGVSDHHVTVVYLGPDVDDEAFAEACRRARSAAASVPGPLNGMVGGIGTFPPSGGSDGKVPVWAGVTLPGAERLRSALEDLSASEHKDWKPHVTVTYADPGDPLPPPVPSMQVSVSHLSVHRGDDEVVRYPIGGDPAETLTGQALGLAGDAPDAPAVPAAAAPMLTAHRVTDVLHHLGHAADRMKAAKASSGDLRAHHSGHLAAHLGDALGAAHDLTAVMRARYPDEAAELEQVRQSVGLAQAVSEDAKSATAAHLLETTLHELTHGRRHALAMTEGSPGDTEWAFNADHAGKHLGGAIEHAGKLRDHLADNYPAEAEWLGPAPAGGGGKQEPQHARYDKGGTITAQAAGRGLRRATF